MGACVHACIDEGTDWRIKEVDRRQRTGQAGTGASRERNEREERGKVEERGKERKEGKLGGKEVWVLREGDIEGKLGEKEAWTLRGS
jgi:hypothetical protein